MRLEPVYTDGDSSLQPAGGGPSLPPGAVTVSPDRQQLIGIRIEEAQRRSGEHEMRLAGKVAVDENRTFTVNAAVDGWVREVFPISTGSMVSQDQSLATFYSKEFLPAQQNFFYALNSLDRVQKSEFGGPEQISLTNVQVWSNEDTLEGLGMGQTQIKELARTRKYSRNIVIRAPAAGFVLARNVSTGQRFQRGQELYRIADLRRVWILADVFGGEARYIRPGQRARVSLAGGDNVFRAMVSEVLPRFDPDTRTLKVRLELDNPSYALRPDMFVDVVFPVELPPAVTVPVDAVIDSGLRKTVYLDRGNGYFEPRVVETGWRLGDRVQITKGLEPGEHVVISGNFLIDSESRMRLTPASAASMAEKTAAEKDPVCGMDVDPKNPKAVKTEHGGKTWYFCSDHCKKSFQADPGKYLPKQKQGNKQSAHDGHGGRAPA
jgi:multidrug efflux pump subunit AcrA (membrane-fusion protein)/YHS domain-containing protein